jgi:transcriptional regulator with XRE-family HTH domain
MEDRTDGIPDRIREWRRRRGLTQEELAERSGLSLAVIKKIEQGGTGRMETYHQLAKALGVRTVAFVAPASPEPTEEEGDAAVLQSGSAESPCTERPTVTSPT